MRKNWRQSDGRDRRLTMDNGVILFLRKCIFSHILKMAGATIQKAYRVELIRSPLGSGEAKWNDRHKRCCSLCSVSLDVQTRCVRSAMKLSLQMSSITYLVMFPSQHGPSMYSHSHLLNPLHLEVFQLLVEISYLFYSLETLQNYTTVLGVFMTADLFCCSPSVTLFAGKKVG